jgi:hypothetical protein
MDYIFTPKGFLVVGGAVLVLLGVIGFAGILTESAYPSFWLDTPENVAHVGLGVIALAAVYVPGLNTALAPYYKWIVALVGVIGIFFAVYGQFFAASTSPNTFGIANLESPLDNILHLVVGVWALWAAFKPMSMMSGNR